MFACCPKPTGKRCRAKIRALRGRRFVGNFQPSNVSLIGLEPAMFDRVYTGQFSRSDSSVFLVVGFGFKRSEPVIGFGWDQFDCKLCCLGLLCRRFDPVIGFGRF